MLYNTDMSHLVILSPLNNFMVSSMVHNKEEQSLQWGLMGSITVSVIHDYCIDLNQQCSCIYHVAGNT